MPVKGKPLSEEHKKAISRARTKQHTYEVHHLPYTTKAVELENYLNNMLLKERAKMIKIMHLDDGFYIVFQH